jgi:hypothetical protein
MNEIQRRIVTTPYEPKVEMENVIFESTRIVPGPEKKGGMIGPLFLWTSQP